MVVSENKSADACAANARNGEIKQVNTPHKDCIKFEQSKLKAKWQAAWDYKVNNKLHLVKPVAAEWKLRRHQEHFIKVILL